MGGSILAITPGETVWNIRSASRIPGVHIEHQDWTCNITMVHPGYILTKIKNTLDIHFTLDVVFKYGQVKVEQFSFQIFSFKGVVVV